MKFILSFVCIFFLAQTAYTTEIIDSEAQYLDYGSEFKHPLYQVRYKVIQSKKQNNPDIFLFMCGRGMSLEMYQDWIEDFIKLEAQNNPHGVIVYIMNFPGQIVLRKDQLHHSKFKGWKGVVSKVQEEFVRRYRGSIKNYNEYILATNAMVNLIYAKHKKPIAIAAHSMGGHIALRYALHVHQAFDLDQTLNADDYLRFANSNPMALEISRCPISKYHIQSPTELIRGIVLVSPMFDVNTGKFSKKFARRLSTVASFVGFGGAYVPGASDYNYQRDSFRGDKQTSFEKGYKKLKKLRKKYGLPMVTYAWLKATFDSIRYLEKADFSSFNIPILATLAKDEHVVLNKEARLILSRIKSAKIKNLEGMHTPFVERPEIRHQLISRISKFFDNLPNKGFVKLTSVSSERSNHIDENSMQLIINKNQACWGTTCFPCAIGKNGLTTDKVEGDGKTPVGTFSFREVFYRYDRIGDLKTVLNKTIIRPDMGWCDHSDHPYYNKLITRPFPASHEMLYRDDHLYDIILVIGYNDDPIVPRKGSAVFVHLARDDFTGTAGCIAFKKDDLLTILSQCSADSTITIQAP